ncbi:MAG: 5'-deoxyadenosine deaminase [Acidobacteria bacterium]|nr:5'-deoxyadenosine deaminase [Acidobacteriota bacterium]
MSQSIFIKGGTVVSVDANDSIRDADVFIRNGRIEQIRDRQPATEASLSSAHSLDEQQLQQAHPDMEIIEAGGCAVLPGFVQTHIHLCQTIMRGAADDLRLIDWLKKRVWPMEAAHNAASLYASARLGLAEMLLGGTTTALTMETVQFTEEVFRAVDEVGFRATVGKCMMDKGAEVPRALAEKTRASVHESLRLLEAWHGRGEGRIRYAFAPRFAVSCTRDLLEEVAGLAQERGVCIHTHASESQEEIAIVRAETGRENISYLESLGLLGGRTVLAHCVWATEAEIEVLAATKTGVAHCPSSNLKLASGIAPVTEMMAAGVKLSLGADGAPCNNRLDMLTEMRSAALLQKVRCGPEALPARAALRLATIDGARALGLDKEIGSIEEGKRADVIIMNLDKLHLTPQPDMVSTIVYSAERTDVETVIVDGSLLMQKRQLLTLDEDEVKAEARQQSRELVLRCE